MKTPFEILGIPNGSSVDVAKTAFRKLAHKYHPDKQGGNAKKFIEVKTAFEDIEKGITKVFYSPFSQNNYSDFLRKQNEFYDNIMRKQEALQKEMERIQRQREELLRKQHQETTEEWKRRMYNSTDI